MHLAQVCRHSGSRSQQAAKPPSPEWPRRDARSVNNARGSPPAWLNPEPSTLKSLLVLSIGPEWGSRIPARQSGAGVLEALGRPFFDLGRFLGASWAMFSHIFAPSHDLNRFFPILDRFLEVLGWFGEDFGKAFSMFFRIIIEHCDFVKNSVSPRKNHYF